MPIETNPGLFARDFIRALGGDAVLEIDGIWYLGDRDPETDIVMPVCDDDNGGEYIAVEPLIRQAVYADSRAANEPNDEAYADAVIASLKELS